MFSLRTGYRLPSTWVTQCTDYWLCRTILNLNPDLINNLKKQFKMKKAPAKQEPLLSPTSQPEQDQTTPKDIENYLRSIRDKEGQTKVIEHLMTVCESINEETNT